METLVIQDYEIKPDSLMHGQFLVELFESYPEVVVLEVSRFYPYKVGMKYYSIEVPENLAVILKLRFGAFLKTRPVKEIKSGNYFQCKKKILFLQKSEEWGLDEMKINWVTENFDE